MKLPLSAWIWIALITAATGFMAWLTYRNWTQCSAAGHDFWYCFQTLG